MKLFTQSNINIKCLAKAFKHWELCVAYRLIHSFYQPYKLCLKSWKVGFVFPLYVFLMFNLYLFG